MAVGCNFSPHRIFAAFVESLWVDVAKNNTLTLTLTPSHKHPTRRRPTSGGHL